MSHGVDDPELEARMKEFFSKMPVFKRSFVGEMVNYLGPIEDDDQVMAMRYAAMYGVRHNLPPDDALTKVQEAEARLVTRLCDKGGLHTGPCRAEIELVQQGEEYWLLKCPSHGFVAWSWTVPSK